MKKVINFFKNRIVFSIIGLLALCLLVWFAGAEIKFGADNSAPLGSDVARLITILVLVVFWGLNNLRVQLLNKKHNGALVEDLQENHENSAADIASSQSGEELQQMSQRFSDALATLKKLKFNNKNNSKALYQLPWYIIIGPPGSGKTTALVNSSLDFPLAEQFGKAALQGVGGTRNCDWWFTNEAVLIDTAGRYTTQDSHRIIDSNAWQGFLKLLKKNRRRRPINGAIVAISLHDLLLQTEEERVQHAKIIRSRIDELMDRLEIRFPVYLMFTKADLVSGFGEFFEDLSREEREQVWGVSLPNAPAADEGPDFEFLNVEFEKLVDRLYARELPRIQYERDVKRRAAIQGFPQQMENLKSVVDGFIRQTFIKNRFRFQPYLRGIYFTSGTQDGTPIDRLMTSVAANFGFGADSIQVQQGQGKSYFLGNLFREVIFPEAELVGSNRRYESAIKWLQRGAYATLLLAAVGLLSVWTGSLSQHKTFMVEVESSVAEFNAAQKLQTGWNKDIRVVIPMLDALANASRVYDREEHPWLTGFGLYDGQVDASANAAYEAQLRAIFLPRLLYYLEKKIQQGHEGGDLYHNFRTYMMFNKLEYMNKQIVIDWFVEDWRKTMDGEASRRIQLEKHLKALLQLQLEPYKLNQSIVKNTRSLLLRVPVHQRIYSRLKTNPENIQKIDLLNLFGESVRDTFVINDAVKSTLMIPYMFTREGYESIDLSSESNVIADIMNERWVLSPDGKSGNDYIRDDLDEITQKVKDLYLADYLARWKKVMSVLKVDKIRNLAHAGEVLASFTDPVYSPLLAVLQVTAANTQLSSPLLQNLNDDQADKGSKVAGVTGLLAKNFKGTAVDQHFRDINILTRESNKRGAPINAVVDKIQVLQDFVGEIMVAPNPSSKAFSVAKARYKSGSGNAITALKSSARKVPEPIESWIESLSSETWKVVLTSARQHVNSEWAAVVYKPYTQGLAGRYPLNRNSREELALFDFSEFFKPDGIMDGFFVEYIKPFINTRKGWSNRAIDNYSLGFSSQALKQIKTAQAIKSIFFRVNPEVPGISFQLKPNRMNKLDARFRLEVGEQKISYKHGPKFWKDLTWSGADENKRVRILFEDLEDKRHQKTFDGPWAWFRLQDDSKLEKTNKSNVFQVTYQIVEEIGSNAKFTHSIQFLIKAKSVNNPFSKDLLGAFKCPKTL